MRHGAHELARGVARQLCVRVQANASWPVATRVRMPGGASTQSAAPSACVTANRAVARA